MIAMMLAITIVGAAILTGHQMGKAPCPRCRKPYFMSEKTGRQIYNAFASRCMNCGWQPRAEEER